IKAQTHKCVVLRSFSSAITQRILDLQVDTKTLDQGQTDVAVAILNDLKAHVAEQIRHQELVEQHAQEISTLVGASECHSSALYELDGRVTGIEAAVGGVVDRLSDYEDVVERGRGID